jgi:hypothetical protein
VNRRLLAIYLNDHLAGSTLGLELARRALRENRGTAFGAFLDGLAREIAEDRESLQRLMEALAIPRSHVKPALAVAAERIGRLKLNGSVRSYSPLSRLLELEGLTIGVEGKLAMWRNLKEAVALPPGGPDLEELIARGERQRAELERRRVEAAKLALGPD